MGERSPAFCAILLRGLHHLSWSLITYKVLTFLLTTVIQTISIKYLMPHAIISAPPIYLKKYWLRISNGLMISGVIFTGLSSLDLIILEIFGSNEAQVGIFAAVLTKCNC